MQLPATPGYMACWVESLCMLVSGYKHPDAYTVPLTLPTSCHYLPHPPASCTMRHSLCKMNTVNNAIPATFIQTYIFDNLLAKSSKMTHKKTPSHGRNYVRPNYLSCPYTSVSVQNQTSVCITVYFHNMCSNF